jgi:predicted nucleotidyltransferase component of viral defense system
MESAIKYSVGRFRMITKQKIQELSAELGLLASTVNKDYVLGWLLAGVCQHPELSKWVFKGGTCLKKTYFDTYRFSEDLDFTVPENAIYSQEAIFAAIKECANEAHKLSGIEFLIDEIEIIPGFNKRQIQTFDIKVPFQGPIRQPPKSPQRILFNITQDEKIVSDPEWREIFHGYPDAPNPLMKVLCYSADEILAEKSRALYEREGRARDIYDIVNISRNFRDQINVDNAKKILKEKFEFKGLPLPNVSLIMARIDKDYVRRSWDAQLRHQLPVLPPVDDFLEGVEASLYWWIEDRVEPQSHPISVETGEQQVTRTRFSNLGIGRPMPSYISSIPQEPFLNKIRFGSRNHLCVIITYNGVDRLVEPYSLRKPKTGNLLLYVYELQRGGRQSQKIKAFKMNQIQSVTQTEIPFVPRFTIEL